MNKVKIYLKEHTTFVVALLLLCLGIGCLLIYKLGSLTGGVSAQEYAAGRTPVGWHGLYHQAFYLPMQLTRSIDYFLFAHHGQTLTRLPSILFGGMTMLAFAWIVFIWHGTRTALLTSLLFVTSAWVLHVSRYAGYEVLYLWAVTLLILSHVGMQRLPDKAYVFLGAIMCWSTLLYVPGMVWFVIAEIVWQRKQLIEGWRAIKSTLLRIVAVCIPIVILPLLAINLARPHSVTIFLGLPNHLSSVTVLAKHFGGVFVHIFVRGPQYPEYWLGKSPLMDIFTLTAFVFGLVFYLSKWRASRTRYLGLMSIIAVLLITLDGPVGFSSIIPIVYLIVAAGIAYLLHDWLKTFPRNPVARSLGIGLVSLAVVLACAYNLRSYFVAWPHNTVTQSIFRYRL